MLRQLHSRNLFYKDIINIKWISCVLSKSLENLLSKAVQEVETMIKIIPIFNKKPAIMIISLVKFKGMFVPLLVQ